MSGEDMEIGHELDLIDHPAARFLGREFLIWLWWRSERDFGSVELGDLGSVDFWIDDRIVFRTAGDNPQTSDLKGGAPATTAEARTALLAGKTIDAARVGLRVKEREYTLEVRSEGLEIAGLKVPSEVKDGVDEKLYERMFLLEEATGILDTMFDRFAVDRLGDQWDSHLLPEIRDWIAAG